MTISPAVSARQSKRKKVRDMINNDTMRNNGQLLIQSQREYLQDLRALREEVRRQSALPWKRSAKDKDQRQGRADKGGLA